MPRSTSELINELLSGDQNNNTTLLLESAERSYTQDQDITAFRRETAFYNSAEYRKRVEAQNEQIQAANLRDIRAKTIAENIFRDYGEDNNQRKLLQDAGGWNYQLAAADVDDRVKAAEQAYAETGNEEPYLTALRAQELVNDSLRGYVERGGTLTELDPKVIDDRGMGNTERFLKKAGARAATTGGALANLLGRGVAAGVEALLDGAGRPELGDTFSDYADKSTKFVGDVLTDIHDGINPGTAPGLLADKLRDQQINEQFADDPAARITQKFLNNLDLDVALDTGASLLGDAAGLGVGGKILKAAAGKKILPSGKQALDDAGVPIPKPAPGLLRSTGAPLILGAQAQEFRESGGYTGEEALARIGVGSVSALGGGLLGKAIGGRSVEGILSAGPRAGGGGVIRNTLGGAARTGAVEAPQEFTESAGGRLSELIGEESEAGRDAGIDTAFRLAGENADELIRVGEDGAAAGLAFGATIGAGTGFVGGAGNLRKNREGAVVPGTDVADPSPRDDAVVDLTTANDAATGVEGDTTVEEVVETLNDYKIESQQVNTRGMLGATVQEQAAVIEPIMLGILGTPDGTISPTALGGIQEIAQTLGFDEQQSQVFRAEVIKGVNTEGRKTEAPTLESFVSIVDSARNVAETAQPAPVDGVGTAAPAGVRVAPNTTQPTSRSASTAAPTTSTAAPVTDDAQAQARAQERAARQPQPTQQDDANAARARGERALRTGQLPTEVDPDTPRARGVAAARQAYNEGATADEIRAARDAAVAGREAEITGESDADAAVNESFETTDETNTRVSSESRNRRRAARRERVARGVGRAANAVTETLVDGPSRAVANAASQATGTALRAGADAATTASQAIGAAVPAVIGTATDAVTAQPTVAPGVSEFNEARNAEQAGINQRRTEAEAQVERNRARRAAGERESAATEVLVRQDQVEAMLDAQDFLDDNPGVTIPTEILDRMEPAQRQSIQREAQLTANNQQEQALQERANRLSNNALREQLAEQADAGLENEILRESEAEIAAGVDPDSVQERARAQTAQLRQLRREARESVAAEVEALNEIGVTARADANLDQALLEAEGDRAARIGPIVDEQQRLAERQGVRRAINNNEAFESAQDVLRDEFVDEQLQTNVDTSRLLGFNPAAGEVGTATPRSLANAENGADAEVQTLLNVSARSLGLQNELETIENDDSLDFDTRQARLADKQREINANQATLDETIRSISNRATRSGRDTNLSETETGTLVERQMDVAQTRVQQYLETANDDVAENEQPNTIIDRSAAQDAIRTARGLVNQLPADTQARIDNTKILDTLENQVALLPEELREGTATRQETNTRAVRDLVQLFRGKQEQRLKGTEPGRSVDIADGQAALALIETELALIPSVQVPDIPNRLVVETDVQTEQDLLTSARQINQLIQDDPAMSSPQLQSDVFVDFRERASNLAQQQPRPTVNPNATGERRAPVLQIEQQQTRAENLEDGAAKTSVLKKMEPYITAVRDTSTPLAAFQTTLNKYQGISEKTGNALKNSPRSSIETALQKAEEAQREKKKLTEIAVPSRVLRHRNTDNADVFYRQTVGVRRGRFPIAVTDAPRSINGSATTPRAFTSTVPDVNREVMRFLTGMVSPPPVQTVQSYGQLPQAVRDSLESQELGETQDFAVRGAVMSGKVYLVADNLYGPQDVSHVLMEEILGHIGLARKYGPNLKPELDRLYRVMGGKDGVLRMADRFGIDLKTEYKGLLDTIDTSPKQSVANKEAQRSLVYELIAHGAAVSNLEPRVQKEVNTMVGKIKRWLVRAFPLLQRRLDDSFTDNDFIQLVKEASHAARNSHDFSIDDNVARPNRAYHPGEYAVALGKENNRTTYRHFGGRIDNTRSSLDAQADALQRTDNTLVGDRVPVLQAIIDLATELATYAYDFVMGTNLTENPNNINRRQRLNNNQTWLNIQKKFQNSRVFARNIEQQIFRAVNAGGLNVEEDIYNRLFNPDAKRLVTQGGNTFEDDSQTNVALVDGNIDQRFAAQFDGARYPANSDEPAGSLNTQAFADMVAIDQQLTLQKGKALDRLTRENEGYLRNISSHLNLLAAHLDGISKSAAQNTASSVMIAQHAQERNNTMWYMHGAPLLGAEQKQREGLIEIMAEKPPQGVSQTQHARATYQQIVALVNKANINPSERAAYRAAGMTDQMAQSLLDEVRNSRKGETTMRIVQDIEQEMKGMQINHDLYQKEAGSYSRRYHQARLAYNWKHYVPLTNNFDQASGNTIPGMYRSTDSLNTNIDNTTGRVSESHNVIENQIQEVQKAVEHRYDQDVNRAVLLNTMGTNNSAKLRDVTGNYYAGSVRRVDINDQRFQALNNDGNRRRVIYYDKHNENNQTGEQYAWVVELDSLDAAESIKGVRATQMEQALKSTGLPGALNWVTRQMTQKNINFWPVNVLRDVIFSSSVLGAEVNGAAVKDFMGNLLSTGRSKALLQYLYHYQRGEFDAIKTLVANDGTGVLPSLNDFFESGGKISFLAQVGTGEPDTFATRFNGGAVRQTSRKFDESFDYINNFGELLTRFSAFSALRQQGWSKERAASYAKNLANFENSGVYGGVLGGLFGFFRASATGAARTIESFLTGKNGVGVGVGLFMAGVALYGLAWSMAGGDDEDNIVANSDKGQWTKSFHFPVGDPDNKWFLSLPFGFGWGGAAAVGAQTLAMLMGHQSFAQMGNNVFRITTDNISPLQPSSISLVDKPVKAIGDSLTPTVLRPIVQYMMNLNSWGVPIRNELTAGYDGINAPLLGRPGTYDTWYSAVSDTARAIGINVSPDLIKHFSNGWALAGSQAIDVGWEWSRMAGGYSDDYIIDAKRTFPGFRSFFNRPLDTAGTEFYKRRDEINALITHRNKLEERNETGYLLEFQRSHPQLDRLNDIENGYTKDLKVLSDEAKELRLQKTPTAQYRKQKRAIDQRVRELQREFISVTDGLYF